MRFSFCVAFLSAATLWTSTVAAQEHVWGKYGTPRTRPVPPTIFLDQPDDIVAFQLERLSDDRLLMTHRRDDDPAFTPIYEAMLLRGGLSADALAEAVDALQRFRDTDRVALILSTMQSLPDDSPSAKGLISLLIKSDRNDLASATDQLVDAAGAKKRSVRLAGLAGLITAGNVERAIDASKGRSADLFAAVGAATRGGGVEPNASMLEPLVSPAIDSIDQSDDLDAAAAAAKALPSLPIDDARAFALLAGAATGNPQVRDAAVAAMLRLDPTQFDQDASKSVLQRLVSVAEKTPKAKRTSNTFLDSMTLADRLLGRVPSADAKRFRSRLRDVTVRLVRIGTVEEEMRYDVPHFAVEAGRPVQIVLINHDVMPHNLVIGQPGTLKQVAADGLAVGPVGGWKGLPYVPESDDVLQATRMINPEASDRITFDAPTEPGEYPYVCTFPQHWYRMYGVMIVVDDLDAYLRDPFEPASPIGSNRTFVAKWKIDDFEDSLGNEVDARDPSIGQKVFAEASCAGCHKMGDQGGIVGPALDEIYAKYKGDDRAVLNSILHPSEKIEEKYIMQKVLTFDGRVITGVKVGETDDELRLLTSAEDKTPLVLAQDDIDAVVPSDVSIMPKALMDQYTQEEILALLAYLKKPTAQ